MFRLACDSHPRRRSFGDGHCYVDDDGQSVVAAFALATIMATNFALAIRSGMLRISCGVFPMFRAAPWSSGTV
jgi:hypothetical protein